MQELRRVVLAGMLAVLLAACGGGAGEVSLRGWELLSSRDGGATPVTLPTQVPEPALGRDREFALRARVALPAALRDRDLLLRVPSWQAPLALRANGRHLEPTRDDGDAAYRAAAPVTFRIPRAATASEALDLELVARHTWAQSAWIDGAPQLFAEGSGAARARRLWDRANVLAARLALAASLLAVFTFGLVVVFDRRRASYGWFAVQAVFGAFYSAFVLGVVQEALGPAEPTILLVAVACAAVAGVHFTHAHFKLPAPHAGWLAAAGFVALAGLALRDPFAGPRILPWLVVPLVCASVAHQGKVLVALARDRAHRSTAVPVLVAWGGVALFGAPDMAVWLGFGDVAGGGRIGALGVAVLALAHFVVLSRDHTASLRAADALNDALALRLRELEARHREIKTLNDELRRQVASRSREIADTLLHSTGLPAAPPSSGALGVGEVVGGRYRVRRRLGAGAMGAVYEVSRVVDGRRFALKILARTQGGDAVARFAREAQIVAEIDHPHVVGVVDVDATPEGGLYLVMELVAGRSLEQVALEAWDYPRALALLAQVASGLAAVHARGVVHRDLKPANVLVTEEGGRAVAKIADFGIASLGRTTLERDERAREPELGPEPSSGVVSTALLPPPSHPGRRLSLTETGIIMGTPRYMAPELVLGAKQVEPPSDVFAFALVAYEVLSGGADAFVEPPVVAFFNGRLAERTRPFGVVCADLSPKLAAQLDRALALEPGARPTATELAAAFGNELVDTAVKVAAES